MLPFRSLFPFSAVLLSTVLLCATLLPAVAPAIAPAATVVENPAEPPETRLVLRAVEEWRAGGLDDEEVLFGVISDVDMDAEGNLYVADRQLTEVSRFSPSGEFLGFVGREGEGPGEYRRIGPLYVTGGGEIAVIQRMPGHIIPVRLDGTPGTTVELPDFLEGSPVYIFSADTVGEDIVLNTRRFARTDEGVEITTQLLRVDRAGELVASLVEQPSTRDPSMRTVDEKENAETLWSFDDAGRVFVYDRFDGYLVKVFAPDGTLAFEIQRPYESRKRSAEEKRRNTPRMAIRGRGGGRRNLEGIPSDTDRDVQALYGRSGGGLWVASSRGALDAPDGVLVTLDEFDAEGRYLRQVDILGDGELGDDGIYLFGDRLILLRGLRDAYTAAWGSDEGVEDEDAEPMSLVSYRLVEEN